jgi:hypothetical protein
MYRFILRFYYDATGLWNGIILSQLSIHIIELGSVFAYNKLLDAAKFPD